MTADQPETITIPADVARDWVDAMTNRAKPLAPSANRLVDAIVVALPKPREVGWWEVGFSNTEDRYVRWWSGSDWLCEPTEQLPSATMPVDHSRPMVYLGRGAS